MNVAILDLETSEKPILHPWMLHSYLSTIGLRMYMDGESTYKEWVFEHSELNYIDDEDEAQRKLSAVFEIQEHLDRLGPDDYLVGHNFKFDMNWLKHVNVSIDHCKVWDTMLVEFMLSGQDKEELPLKKQDLSNCCERHGLSTKTDKVKAYWDAGYHTKDIPLKILLPYQKNDVDITAELFKSQYKQARSKEALFKLINIRNQVLHPVTDIELAGMPFDKEKSEYWVDHFQKELEVSNAELRSYFGRDDINLGSGPELSACLFGGVLKRTRHVPHIFTRNVTVKDPYKFTYKSGHKKGMTYTKYRNRVLRELTCRKRKDDYEIDINGLGFTPPKNSKTSVDGVYQTNKGVLATLTCPKTNGSSRQVKQRVLEILLHRSKISQFTGTFVGAKEDTGLFHHVSLNSDGRTHGSYNQTIAATGRFTSSNPNQQNFPRSKEDEDGFTNPLKSVFIPSRPDGLILAADLSQLEWRVAALLSGDPVAIQEINDGADIHLDNAIKFFGDASFRQAAKIMTFRLLYGGTAYAFFMDTQMPDFSMKKWDSIVKAYGHKYCVLIAWQQQNIIDVPQQGGILYSPSGREYKIPMVEHKKHKGVMVYKDAVIKNYMIQGFATGDVVPLCMNAVWERMQLNISAYQSTNWFGQVHDSILFDTIGCEVRPLAHLCIQVFESIPKMLYDTWGIKSPIEFTGEVEVGPDYSNMTHSVSHEGDKWVTKGDWSVFV